MNSHSRLSQTAIWDTADKYLRSVVPRQEYGDYIIPFLVLRRLECILTDTKTEVIEYLRTDASSVPHIRDVMVTSKFGLPFYNSSKLDLPTIAASDDRVKQALFEYLDGFSSNVSDIWESFNFRAKAQVLDKANRLWAVIKHFSTIDLHPDSMDDTAMGDLFENLMYRAFSTKGNDAGEFYTPRDAIQLMADILIRPDDPALQGRAPARSVYDPTAGTGGMLLVAARTLKELNDGIDVSMYGQELTSSSFAIGKADLLIQGGRPDAIRHGNTLTHDLYAGKTFDYVMSNPPYGTDWSADKEMVLEEAETPGSRFSHGLPGSSDGQMLFLSHVVSKMRPAGPDGTGGRAGVVMNGSPLFTGGPGSGPDRIRAWLLTEDLVEAIIALPTSMFYNTGIATFVWILATNKAEERRGKIQLIDATGQWSPMQKGMGDKRREMRAADRKAVLHAFEVFEDSELSKIVTPDELGFREVPVYRPRRLRTEVTDEAIEIAMSHKAAVGGHRDVIRAVVDTPWNGLPGALKDAAKSQGLKMPLGLIDAIVAAVGEDDPAAPVAIDRKGNVLAEQGSKMTERIPLSDDIAEHMRREVLPFAPDARWDEDAAKIGYELPITRL
ncbi:MAG: type I restriction-modification system subunit M, partial [Brachybacterium sp.]|nr:type I restriction-modification system subunit M [Brachybacterium sp.]